MNVGIIGITGRMGSELTKLIPLENLVGGMNSQTTEYELEEIIEKSDVIIDFSRPIATFKALAIAKEYKRPYVCGTTGFIADEFEKISQIAKHIPILYASNFSLGVQFVASVLRQASQIFQDFDFSIIERHHKHKKDAPSGTALFLAKQVELPHQIVAIRAGSIAGEHSCSFTGDDEEITITHKAFNRAIFAKGALDCAEWLIGKEPGLYSVEDFLQDRLNDRK